MAEHLAVIDKTSSEKMNATAVRQKEAFLFLEMALVVVRRRISAPP